MHGNARVWIFGAAADAADRVVRVLSSVRKSVARHCFDGRQSSFNSRHARTFGVDQRYDASEGRRVPRVLGNCKVIGLPECVQAHRAKARSSSAPALVRRACGSTQPKQLGPMADCSGFRAIVPHSSAGAERRHRTGAFCSRTGLVSLDGRDSSKTPSPGSRVEPE